MTEIAAKILLCISAFLGVSPIVANFTNNWTIIQDWSNVKGASNNVFIAENTSLVEQCKKEPESYIHFPSVVHGSHVFSLDGKEIYKFGNADFSKAHSFYYSPSLPCESVVAGTVLQWKVYSYASYFARISSVPSIDSSPSGNVFFTDTLNIGAAFSLIVLSIFCFVIFWRKVSNELTISVFIACICISIYFICVTAPAFVLPVSMLTAHKVADSALWVGIYAIINALKVEKLISYPLLYALFASIFVAQGFIIFGANGDVIQLGTTIPFAFALANVIYAGVQLSKQIAIHEDTRSAYFKLAAAFIFIISGHNDIFFIMGITNGVPLLSVGMVGVLLSLALAVNDKIIKTYVERDYLRENLENEVKEKTKQLTSTLNNLQLAQAELVQSAKLASLGTLSAGVAHEINNSINYVNGALVPLERKLSKSMSVDEYSKFEPLIKAIKDGTQYTVEIVKSLRNFTGLNQAKEKEVNLEEVVKSVLTILKSKLQKFEVSCEVDPTLSAFINVISINQILMNLITNSIDAMGETGKLGIRVLKVNENLSIEISDSGAGIPDNVKQKIFDPFFTTKEVGKGTGLGLHIVKKEVDRLKGRVEVESELNKGTKFKILIPHHLKFTDEIREAA